VPSGLFPFFSLPTVPGTGSGFRLTLFSCSVYLTKCPAERWTAVIEFDRNGIFFLRHIPRSSLEPSYTY
jgi:hypothetical protein